MEKKIEDLFVSFSDNFVEEFKSSALDKLLTNKERQELFEIVGRSISQTIQDVFDECNEEKIEGDRKDA